MRHNIDRGKITQDGYLILPVEFEIPSRSSWHFVTINRLEFFLVPQRNEFKDRREICTIDDFQLYYPESEVLDILSVHKNKLGIPSIHLNAIFRVIAPQRLFLRLFVPGFIRLYDSLEHSFAHRITHPTPHIH